MHKKINNREQLTFERKDKTFIKSKTYSGLSLLYLKPCKYKKELQVLKEQKVKKMKPKHSKIEKQK